MHQQPSTKKKVLFVDDDPNLIILLTHTFERYGYITKGIQDPFNLMDDIANFYPHVICLDISIPGKDGITLLREVKENFPHIPVIMVTAMNNVESAIESLRAGAFHYIRKPINREELTAAIDQALELRSLKSEVTQFKRQVKTEFDLDSLIGFSPVYVRIREQLEKLARVPEAPVLITGETGTGKSFLAKILHYITPESAGNSFVEVNASAIPHSIFESELFGYMKGAFTDAKKDKIGLVEEAQDGTLFLDEIDSVPLETQSKLLSFLESKKIRRIGGVKDITVNNRVIVATNADLKDQVKKGEFREDLFYRINVVNLRMPSLREVPNDIPVLAQRLLDEASDRFKKGDFKLSDAAQKAIIDYDFPGNVRELRNILERALIFASGTIIDVEDLNLGYNPNTKSKPFLFGVEDLMDLENLEKDYIRFILDHHANSYQEAAQILNISTKNLWEKRKKYNL